MKILVGSLGRLGYLVKPVPAGEARSWRRFEDEAALTAHLRDLSISAPDIRAIYRTLRGEGRAILTLSPPGPGTISPEASLRPSTPVRASVAS
ncbi:MAG: hypothetical protein ACRD16_06685 [Thermoanaerobaculia bacterium]